MSSLYILATTASYGSSGSGAQSKAYKEIRAVLIVNAGVHSFLRISRQIAPVYELMFGCQIFVSNFIFGGLNGYSDGISMSTRNVPPEYGVSAGPKIVPFQ